MSHRDRGLAVLCGAMFVSAVDMTIVNVALPAISEDLNAGMGELQWVLDAFLVAFAGLLLMGSGLADRFGRKKVFLGGMAAFGVASILCALSRSPETLIGARVLMGGSLACVAPPALSLIDVIFPGEERQRALSVWVIAAGMGLVLGPVLGGFLVSEIGWQAVFLVNVPVAAGVVAVGLAVLPESTRPGAPPLDLPGVALSVVSLGSIVFALIEGPESGWTSPAVVATAATGLVDRVPVRARRAAARAPPVRHPGAAPAGGRRGCHRDHLRLLRLPGHAVPAPPVPPVRPRPLGRGDRSAAGAARPRRGGRVAPRAQGAERLRHPHHGPRRAGRARRLRGALHRPGCDYRDRPGDDGHRAVGGLLHPRPSARYRRDHGGPRRGEGRGRRGGEPAGPPGGRGAGRGRGGHGVRGLLFRRHRRAAECPAARRARAGGALDRGGPRRGGAPSGRRAGCRDPPDRRRLRRRRPYRLRRLRGRGGGRRPVRRLRAAPERKV